MASKSKEKSETKSNARQGKLKKTFKVLVIGATSVGKTNFIKRYIHGRFDRVSATIGCDISVKMLDWDNRTDICLQLYDTSGEEKFMSMVPQYYRNMVGCLLFFDLSRPETFSACVHWKSELDKYARLRNGAPISCVLVANKCDLVEEKNRPKAAILEKFCRDNGIVYWFFTSAKEDVNIEAAFRFLVYDILLKEKEQEPDIDLDNIQLNEVEAPPSKKRCCRSQ